MGADGRALASPSPPHDPSDSYDSHTVITDISTAPPRAPQPHPPLIKEYGVRWEWSDDDKDYIRFDGTSPDCEQSRKSRDQRLTCLTIRRRQQAAVH
jgi:hypothetical protein